MRYKRDSVPERMLRHPIARQNRWSVQNDGRACRRFWAEGPRLVKRVGYGRTILGVRYKRDSVHERTVGRPVVCPKRWSVRTDGRASIVFLKRWSFLGRLLTLGKMGRIWTDYIGVRFKRWSGASHRLSKTVFGPDRWSVAPSFFENDGRFWCRAHAGKTCSNA